MMKTNPVFLFIISGLCLLTVHADDKATAPVSGYTVTVSGGTVSSTPDTPAASPALAVKKEHNIHPGPLPLSGVSSSTSISQTKEERLRHIPANSPVKTPLSKDQELLVSYVIWTIPQKLFDKLHASNEPDSAGERFIQSPLDYINEDGVVCEAAPTVRIKSGETVKIPSMLIMKYPEQWDDQGRPAKWTEQGLGWDCEVKAYTNRDNTVSVEFNYAHNSLVGYEEKPDSGYLIAQNTGTGAFDVPNFEGKPFYPVFSTRGMQTQVVLPVGSSRSVGGLLAGGKESFHILNILSVVPAPEK